MIGKKITIIDAKNQSLKGISGLISNETKHSFNIKTDTGEKIIIKNTSTFNIEGHIIQGSDLEERPHERLKIKWKRK
ncbi:MAG: ribonuclease P protein subunit [Thermotogota bacterium]